MKNTPTFTPPLPTLPEAGEELRASSHRRETLLLQNLSRQLCEGNPEAWAEIYKRFYDPLNRFIAHIIRSREDASDLSQEVFISLWKNLHNIDPQKSIKGYLYAIGSSLAFRFLRERQRMAPAVPLTDHPEAAASPDAPDQIIDEKETDLLVALTLESMPAQRRRIFEMSRIERMPIQQISEQLSLSRRTVENQIYRATKQLKDALLLVSMSSLLPPEWTL